MTKHRRLHWLALITAGLMAATLTGCGGGDTGATGAEGAPGAQGPAGPAGPPGPSGSSGSGVVASNATVATDASIARWQALAPTATVTGVTMGAAPVVTFKVADASGNPVVGLGNTSKTATATVASYTNLAFSIAKLVPGSNGSPAKWVSYIVTTVPTTTAPTAAPTRPTTDNTGTLVDNGDGTYKYTFYRDITQVKAQVDGMTVTGVNNKADLGDLTYEPGLVHRLTIQVAGNAPGTGTNTPTGATSGLDGKPLVKPLDVIYDFVPSSGQAVAASGRDIVPNAKCNECHRQLGGIPGDTASSSGAGFHGGSRNEVRYCVVCHTEQRKYGQTEAALDVATNTFTSTSTNRVNNLAVGNLPSFIHKLHSGKLLAKKKYNYAGVMFNEVGYPQDIRNCTKCHDGSSTSTAQTANGDNWKNTPNRVACGSCHDGIDFATGKGVTLADAAQGLTSSSMASTGLAHAAGPLPDDSLCGTCHKSDGTFPQADVDLAHLPVTPPNAANALLAGGTNTNTNAAWIASNTSRLPAGAIKVSYDLKSVSVVGGKPRMVFRILQNGARADLKAFDAAQSVATQEIWDNFIGAPSVYFVFAVPQDGVTTPADFNASASSYLRSLWNGTATGTSAGTLTGPDADGYYTATLTGVTIPSTAKMLTGGLGYSYNVKTTLPLTQTNVAGYPVADATGTGLTAGMPNKTGGLIVITPNAQKVATGHTGRRAIVEDKRCNACHQELGTFTEDAFHAGQRNDGTTCSWCHTPNRASSGWSADSASFVHSIHAKAKLTQQYTWHAVSPTEGFWDIGYPGVLKDCETCHLPGTYDFSAAANAAAVPNRLYRTVATGSLTAGFPVAPYVATGAYGSGFAFNAATGVTTEAAGTTLVISPVTTACFSCHDSAQAKAHMETLGGASIYKPRSTALGTVETCMVCHGSGRSGDIKVVHQR